jgi:hypothetical protein
MRLAAIFRAGLFLACCWAFFVDLRFLVERFFRRHDVDLLV